MEIGKVEKATLEVLDAIASVLDKKRDELLGLARKADNEADARDDDTRKRVDSRSRMERRRMRPTFPSSGRR